MSDQVESSELKFQKTAPERREPVEFDEAPGESEADAVRDAFLKNAGPQPASVASALSSADSGTRTNAVNRLQQERGNQYLQRVVAEKQGTPGRLVGQPQSQMVDEVRQRQGSGTPLPSVARDKLEDHFGADLSGVRVHTDGESSALNRELNAQAFTVGSDIFMADGKYQPESSEGQGLLAHELTHVGQQTGFSGQNVQRAGLPEEEENQVQRAAADEEDDQQAG